MSKTIEGFFGFFFAASCLVSDVLALAATVLKSLSQSPESWYSVICAGVAGCAGSFAVAAASGTAAIAAAVARSVRLRFMVLRERVGSAHWTRGGRLCQAALGPEPAVTPGASAPYPVRLPWVLRRHGS